MVLALPRQLKEFGNSTSKSVHQLGRFQRTLLIHLRYSCSTTAACSMSGSACDELDAMRFSYAFAEAAESLTGGGSWEGSRTRETSTTRLGAV
jgi:hypothetical protein